MPSNRTLNIDVEVIGTQGGNGTYSVTSCNYVQQPSTPPMDGVVASNGDVNLGALPNHDDYYWAIDMVYTLKPTITDQNGNSVACTWAADRDKACAITGPGGGAAAGVVLGQLTPTELTIVNTNDDRSKSNPDLRTYTYKLGVILPTDNNFFMSLDPKIVNTGPIGT